MQAYEGYLIRTITEYNSPSTEDKIQNDSVCLTEEEVNQRCSELARIFDQENGIKYDRKNIWSNGRKIEWVSNGMNRVRTYTIEIIRCMITAER